ncbi:hypothetical protein ACFC6L_35100, partial [Kitasatospora phosalacinea]
QPFILPKPVVVRHQVVGLGRVVAELGDEYLFRAAESAPQQYTLLAAEAFANASSSVAQAASALGAVAQQLAYGTAEYAVETARDDLAEAAQTLRAAAAEISLPQDWRSRSPRTATARAARSETGRTTDGRPFPGEGPANGTEQSGSLIRVSAAPSRSAAPEPASKTSQPPSTEVRLDAAGVVRALPVGTHRGRSAP